MVPISHLKAGAVKKFLGFLRTFFKKPLNGV